MKLNLRTNITFVENIGQTKSISMILQNCTRPRISIDDETIRLLERLSLVDFSNVEGKLNYYCRVREQYSEVFTWYDTSYMTYLYSSL